MRVTESGGSRRSPEERAAGTQQEEGDRGACVPRHERKKAWVLAISGKTTYGTPRPAPTLQPQHNCSPSLPQGNKIYGAAFFFFRLNEETEIRFAHKAKVTLLLHLGTEINVSHPFERPSNKESAFDFHSAPTGIGTELLTATAAHVGAFSFIQQQWGFAGTILRTNVPFSALASCTSQLPEDA